MVFVMGGDDRFNMLTMQKWLQELEIDHKAYDICTCPGLVLKCIFNIAKSRKCSRNTSIHISIAGDTVISYQLVSHITGFAIRHEIERKKWLDVGIVCSLDMIGHAITRPHCVWQFCVCDICTQMHCRPRNALHCIDQAGYVPNERAVARRYGTILLFVHTVIQYAPHLAVIYTTLYILVLTLGPNVFCFVLLSRNTE